MSAPIRHALILAAGLGVRLRPLTDVRAKPAVPVAGEPIIRRIVRWLVSHGVGEIVVNLHHLPETIAAVLGDGSELGARVRYSWEQPLVLGSAGGPRQALSIIGAKSFFIVNGDTMTDVNLDDLAAAHHDSGALVTLALTNNVEPSRYGGVLLDGDRVTGFASKGHAAAAGSFHFVGVQAADAGAFRDVPAGRAMKSVGDLYNRLVVERPGSIRGMVTDSAFWDIGTIADYVATSRALEPRGPDPIVWDGVTIGEGAELHDCIVTDGVRVPARARFAHAVLLPGTDGWPVAIPWKTHD